MKRKITLFAFMALFSLSTFANGGWADCAVSITKDGGQLYSYSFTNANWADGIWLLNTSFLGYNFGTPTSLVLNGGIANAWTDDTPGYTSASFIMYYRVYKVLSTPGSWSQIAIDNLNMKNGNNYVYDKTNANINLLALATVPGTNDYIIEIAMSKNQFYTGGNWVSMIPGSQDNPYNSNTSGFQAVFTKSVTTDIPKIESSLQISTEPGKVTARFDGKADVQLYTSTGQLISATSAENEFSKTVKSGVYLLHIAGKSHKVVVQ